MLSTWIHCWVENQVKKKSELLFFPYCGNFITAKNTNLAKKASGPAYNLTTK